MPTGPASSPRILLSHPFGNENVRHTALALAEAGLLEGFYTGLAWRRQSGWVRALPGGLRRQFERRAVPDVVAECLRLLPAREIVRLAAGKMAPHTAVAARWHDANATMEDFDVAVSRALQRAREGEAFYGYDHAALRSMRKARLLGMRTIFDLPIGHWRALRTLLADEHAAWPGWTSPDVTAMSDPRIVDRKDAELAAADLVVVPSNFVRDTLSAYPGSLPRIAVIPFGAPETSEAPPPPPAGDACLRVLFVGGLTLRKGVPYLLDALARTKARVDVTLIGQRIDRSPMLDHALARYRWFPSLPRIEILRMMRSSDVFVLPTLFEGFALVVLEAMSQGCAVITTPNSGADSCIVDGDNGFIVPIRSSEAIVRLLERLQDEPALLAAVRRNARARAAEQTWTKYRAAVRSLVLATCREPLFAGASG